MTNTPVRVTFEMRTPVVVPSTFKPLDAVLSWAAVQQSDFHDALEPIAAQHNIGIAVHTGVSGEPSEWCFKASELKYEWLDQEPSQIHYIKRQSLESYTQAWTDELLDKRPAFNSQSGHTKAGSYVATIRWASRITAYAVVHDMKRLMNLLPWVTHIGKLHHKDFGAVKSFTVLEDIEANQLWTNRILPVGSPFATNHCMGFGGLVSPYWKKENHRDVMFPNKSIF